MPTRDNDFAIAASRGKSRAEMTESNANSAPSSSDATPPKPLEYVHSTNWPDLLNHLGIAVMATTYQAGKLLAFSGLNGRSSLLIRSFPHPMGITVERERMALLCQHSVWELANQPGLVDQSSGERVPYDAYYVPRRAHVTGDIAGHEIAWSRPEGSSSDEPHDELLMVATRFSCLAKLDAQYSFVPVWRPPFITEIRAEDRCHLNGVAMVDGRPRWVSALGATDIRQGWREHRTTGGCVMDVESGAFVTRNLSMPHSPRWYRDQLWILESGTGELQTIDLQTGQRTTVARFPGFVRGLSFSGNFAFVGLSQARESSTFGDLQIQQEYDELECGIYAVDLDRGQIVAMVKFTQGCTELFDLKVVPSVRRLGVVGLAKDTINGIFILPPGSRG